MPNLRRIALLLSVLIFSLGFGTFGFTYFEGWGVFDSFYMTVITLTTIGFMEVHPLSENGRIFTLILIATGLGNMAYILTAFFQTILDYRFDDVIRRARMRKEIEHLKNHTIICGLGRMGRDIIDALEKKGSDFVIIENNPEKEKDLSSMGRHYLIGNAADDEVLKQAGVERAKSLVTVTNSDAENVFITLSARSLNKNVYIISRVFDEKAHAKLEKAGANKVVSPYVQVGHKISQAITNPNIDDLMDFIFDEDSFEFQFADIEVKKNSNCEGKTLLETEFSKSDMVVLGLRKNTGELLFAPNREETLELGDRLIVVGSGDTFNQKIQQYLKG